MSTLAMPSRTSSGSSRSALDLFTPALLPKGETIKFGEKRGESLCAVSWLLAITMTFFVIGATGILFPALPSLEFTLSGMAGEGQDDAPSEETTMAELQAMFEKPAEQIEEQVDPVEVPEVQEVVPEIAEELPEVAETLVTEDLFTVPAAPRIEAALKPVDPAAPKPKPQPKRPSATRVAATRSTGTAAGTAATSGGGSGNGTSGSGGVGKMPEPPYPSWAKAAGMQGSTGISFFVQSDGSVTTSVSSSSGYSRLDQYAADFIQRRWRFPPGSRNRTVKIRFVLR